MSQENFPYYPFPYYQPAPASMADASLSAADMPVYAAGSIQAMDIAEQDAAYMKQLYPKAVRRIQDEINEQCDKLEYEGSCMFDQYPDPVHLQMIVDLICDNLKDIDTEEAALETMALCGPGQPCPSQNQMYPPRPPFPPGPPHPPRPPYPPRPPFPPKPPFPPRPPHPPRPPFPPKPCGPGWNCPPPRPRFHNDGSPNWLRNLTEIMLYNEMLGRRQRYRNRKRMY